jgi:hypothetical protein
MADREIAAAPMNRLGETADKIGRAFSGSWLGYHSHVYYEGLRRPPPGAHFDPEWGLKDVSLLRLGSRGDWKEFDPEKVKSAIYRLAKSPDLGPAADHAAKIFADARDEAVSVLEIELSNAVDPFLTQVKRGLEKLELLSDRDLVRQ